MQQEHNRRGWVAGSAVEHADAVGFEPVQGRNRNAVGRTDTRHDLEWFVHGDRSSL
jgi:hypothetical protein